MEAQLWVPGAGGARHILRTPTSNAWLPAWGGPRPRLGIPQTPTWHVLLPAHSTRGYLYLLEVHRLADELVVLRQLLAGRQLDEHLAELTSTTTARRDTAASLTGPACRGALTPCPAPPHQATPPLLEDRAGEKFKADLGITSRTCAVL